MNSFVSWTTCRIERVEQAEKADLFLRRNLMRQNNKGEEQESVFSDNPDWYLRMQEDEFAGWADYS